MTSAEFSVGDRLIWNSRAGRVEVEYRGAYWSADGKMAVVIDRTPGATPLQMDARIADLERPPGDSAAVGVAVEPEPEAEPDEAV